MIILGDGYWSHFYCGGKLGLCKLFHFPNDLKLRKVQDTRYMPFMHGDLL